MMRAFIGVVAALWFAALSGSIAAQSAATIKVVTSFSILADLARNVGGDRVEVTAIVGPGGDAHVYEPKPEDARNLAGADVVIVNGLGFEGWIERLVDASGYKKSVVVASDGIVAAEMDGATDPHAWQNVQNVKIYVTTIADALCKIDSGACTVYTANAAAYAAKLDTLDAEIKSKVARVPENQRTVISSHDAFGYFARSYGVRFLAPEGISTDSEASAADVANLIRQIRADKASALFVENVSDPRLTEQIARETGLTVSGSLFSDSLSPADGLAATYIDMMRHNANMLTEAMLKN